MRRCLELLLMSTIACAMMMPACAVGQESPKLGGARIEDESTLLKSLLIVCDGKALKYSAVGGDPQGLKSVEVIADDRIVSHQLCNGAADCSASGVALVDHGDSTMFMATVISNDGRQYSERVKVQLGGGTRVYFVGTAPAIDASQFNQPPASTDQPVAASATGTVAVTAATAPTQSAPTAKGSEVKLTENPTSAGPDVKVDIKKQNDNDFIMTVSAFDAGGVDFIEILENGSYMDVQSCNNKPRCVYKKDLKNKNPGRNKYMVKSMNTAGALTFQEQILMFTKAN